MDMNTVLEMMGKPVLFAKWADGEMIGAAKLGRIIGVSESSALVKFEENGAGISCLPEDLYPPDGLILACNQCGYPVIVLPSGSIVHASAADGLFCEMVYPN